MGISIRWDNAEKTIIRWDFEGRWTLDEFRRSLQLSTTLAEDTGHTVYGLVVMRGICPANVVQIRQYVVNQCPVNMRSLVFVGASGLVESTLSILNKLCPNAPQSVFVATVDDAYEIITQLHLKEIYTKP
jgi:hypothetical protein